MLIQKHIKISDILGWATDFLTGYNISSPSLDAQVLLSYVLGINRMDLYLNLRQIMTEDESRRYENLIKKRAKRIPVAYLIGEKEFMGLSFLVNEDVLIPRPETEILVELILNRIGKLNEKRYVIIDLGTGSGNIAVSLAKFIENADIYAIDISKAALNTAGKNAQRQEVGHKINFIQGNMFESLNQFNIKDRADFVISNPPYIKTDILKSLQPEIGFEPRIALDGGKDGLDFYERIISGAYFYLKENGYLALEIADGQVLMIKEMVDKFNGFFDIEIVKDYAGIDRIIIAKKSSDLETERDRWRRL